MSAGNPARDGAGSMRVRDLALAAVAYTAAGVWLCWPLAAVARTHVPMPYGVGVFDAFYGLWVLAWQTHALLTAPAAIAEANVFHPAPHALFYGPAPFGALPAFAPVYAATGSAPLAMNVVFMGAPALTALGAHWVVRRWTGSSLAAVVAGATLVCSGFFRWGTPTSAYYAMLIPVPWILLLASRALPPVVALGVLLALAVAVDPVYRALGIAGPVGALALLRLVRPAWRRNGVRLVLALALAGLLLAPIYLGYALVWQANPALATQTWWGVGPLSVEQRAALWAKLREASAAGGWSLTLPAEASWARLALVAVGLVAAWRRTGAVPPAWTGALLLTAVGVPVVAAGVRPDLALPLLAELGVLRSLARLYASPMVGMALLLGLAFAELERRYEGVRGRARWIPVVAAAILVVAVAWPYTPAMWKPYGVMEAPAPPAATLTALRTGAGPVLELPAGQIDANARAMYRSTFHWRPLVNGYASFWPAGYPERMALAARLPDRDALDALVHATGVELVVVRVAEMPPAARAPWTDEARVRATGLEPVAAGETELVFRVATARP